MRFAFADVADLSDILI